jgi:hypothetical protein
MDSLHKHKSQDEKNVQPGLDSNPGTSEYPTAALRTELSDSFPIVHLTKILQELSPFSLKIFMIFLFLSFLCVCHIDI